jgi:hypothetical protein
MHQQISGTAFIGSPEQPPVPVDRLETVHRRTSGLTCRVQIMIQTDFK